MTSIVDQIEAQSILNEAIKQRNEKIAIAEMSDDYRKVQREVSEIPSVEQIFKSIVKSKGLEHLECPVDYKFEQKREQWDHDAKFKTCKEMSIKYDISPDISESIFEDIKNSKFNYLIYRSIDFSNAIGKAFYGEKGAVLKRLSQLPLHVLESLEAESKAY